MTFKSIDEYNMYMEQVNEEHWEEMAMKEQDQDHFNEMMDILNKELEEEQNLSKHKVTQPTDANVSEEWIRLRKGHTREPTTREVLHKERKQVKALECMMQTDAYLGYLAGANAIAMMENNHILAGFYKGKHDKFVMENTP